MYSCIICNLILNSSHQYFSAAEYCKKLKQERAQMQSEAEILKNEIEALNNAIGYVEASKRILGFLILQDKKTLCYRSITGSSLLFLNTTRKYSPNVIPFISCYLLQVYLLIAIIQLNNILLFLQLKSRSSLHINSKFEGLFFWL